MELADIVARSLQFHRAIYVSLTEKCPIRCRHCFVESEPSRHEHAEFEAFQAWIDGVLAEPRIEVLFFSGGEPYSHPRALRYALDACRRAGRYAVVCTSAFWARSPQGAARLLDHYPLPNCLWLSTDLYHEEFVPLDCLRNAAEAAKARGLDVKVQVVESDPDHTGFMHRLTEALGEAVTAEEIFMTPLSVVGRASEELTEAERATPAPPAAAEIPDAPCTWLGAPWLREDGALCACPNTRVFKSPSHPLHIGHLDRETYGEVLTRAEDDLYLQALRVLGPRGLANELPLADFGWDEAAFAGVNACDLCHSIAAVDGIADRIRAAAAERDWGPRLQALRLAYYQEVRVAPEPPRRARKPALAEP